MDVPHEAFYTPDGRALWVTIRGENYVSVINVAQRREVRRIVVANGPGMTTFGPVASMPIAQTTQALVYVPNAVPNGAPPAQLSPLGQSANSAHLHLAAASRYLARAEASVVVNSLGLLDLIEVAVKSLVPNTEDRVDLTDSAYAPFGTLQALALLRTNPDRSGVVQAVGPFKALEHSHDPLLPSGPRFLIVVDAGDEANVVLRQSEVD